MLNPLCSSVPVFVPRDGAVSMAHVVRGSAIVGKPSKLEDYVIVYYEGNIYGSSNMQRFEDRLFHAWSRMHYSYPTVAMAHIPAADLVQVGDFDPTMKRLTVTDQDALSKWQEREAVRKEA